LATCECAVNVSVDATKTPTRTTRRTCASWYSRYRSQRIHRQESLLLARSRAPPPMGQDVDVDDGRPVQCDLEHVAAQARLTEHAAQLAKVPAQCAQRILGFREQQRRQVLTGGARVAAQQVGQQGPRFPAARRRQLAAVTFQAGRTQQMDHQSRHARHHPPPAQTRRRLRAAVPAASAPYEAISDGSMPRSRQAARSSLPSSRPSCRLRCSWPMAAARRDHRAAAVRAKAMAMWVTTAPSRLSAESAPRAFEATCAGGVDVSTAARPVIRRSTRLALLIDAAKRFNAGNQARLEISRPGGLLEFQPTWTPPDHGQCALEGVVAGKGRKDRHAQPGAAGATTSAFRSSTRLSCHCGKRSMSRLRSNFEPAWASLNQDPPRHFGGQHVDRRACLHRHVTRLRPHGVHFHRLRMRAVPHPA